MTVHDPQAEENLWVIDPLDGTTNVKFGIPFFAVSIAYVERGIVSMGAIYDPSRDELFYAEAGKGAFLNGQEIKTQDVVDFRSALVNVGSPYSEIDFQKTNPFAAMVHQQGGRVVNFGSGALECAYVACGRLSMYYEAGLKPWDIAAGYVLVKEAGATMNSLGNSFSIFQQPEVLVGNKEIVSKALKLLLAK